MARFDTKKSVGRLGGTVFVIIGSLVAVAGMVWLVRTAAFVSRAAKAPGLVIAMDRSDGRRGSVYHPVFTFTDFGGVAHTQRSSIGSSHSSVEAGERVTVLYDSAAPKQSQIQTFQTVWLGPLFVTGFGLLFGGFACFWLFVWSRASLIQDG